MEKLKNSLNFNKEWIKEIFNENNIKPNQNVNSASRGALVDIVEECKRILAQVSHLQENLSSYGTNAGVKEEDVEVAIIEIERLLRMRRTYMNILKKEYNANPHYWCSTKHAMEIAQFAEEIWQADILNTEFFALYKDATEHLYTILSLWLDMPKIVACGRCFHDMMTEDAELKEIIDKNNQ